VRRDTVASGHFRTRAGKGELDQAFFGQSSSEFKDTFTNLATAHRSRSGAGSPAWT
jgi:hypothetical protein